MAGDAWHDQVMKDATVTQSYDDVIFTVTIIAF